MSELIREAYNYFDTHFKDATLSGLANRQVPYTKYTTFLYGYMPLPYYAMRSIDPRSIFIDNAAQQRPTIVYLHIPFCPYKCSFCYYLSTAPQNGQMVQEYIKTLITEIELLSQYIDLSLIPVRSIHMGGGTPTYLDVSQLEYVFASLKRKFNIKGNIPIHCESTPDTIMDEEKVKCLIKHGVRHLDIGIQTFHDPTLALVNRRHTKEMARKAVMSAKKMGMEEINIDMLMNLPDQTLANWEEDLGNIASLRPTSVSIFPNVLKTPFLLSLYYREPHRFLSPQDIVIMQIMAWIALRKEGYHLKMVNLYSLNASGDEQKENIPDVLSFGPRTWSLFNGTEYYKTFDINEYIRRINKKRLPICAGTKINTERKLKQIIASGLQHVSRGVPEELWERYKTQSKTDFHAFEKIEQQKLIRKDNNRVTLSSKGIFFSNDVFREFYRHHEREYLFLRVILNNPFLRRLYFFIRGKEWSYKLFISLNKLLPKIKM